MAKNDPRKQTNNQQTQFNNFPLKQQTTKQQITPNNQRPPTKNTFNNIDKLNTKTKEHNPQKPSLRFPRDFPSNQPNPKNLHRFSPPRYYTTFDYGPPTQRTPSVWVAPSGVGCTPAETPSGGGGLLQAGWGCF